GVAPPMPTAAAYSIAPADPLAASRLAAALREVTDAGIPAVAAAVHARAEEVFALADRSGVPVLTPRDHHAGIVTLQPQPHEAAPLAAALANHGVTATARAGTVRICPHAGTGADSLQLLGGALAEISAARTAVAATPGPEWSLGES
ncbi:MAG: aminotransferase, partial [Microbacterium sp.]